MSSNGRKKKFRRIPASVARANLADVLEAVGEGRERILIERRGKPPIALVSVDDLQTLELIETHAAQQSSRGEQARVRAHA